MRNIDTGQIVPKRCNSYLCPECSALFQMTARHAIEHGLLFSTMARGREAAVFLTLTEPATASLDLPGLSARWKATVKRLRRTWGLTEYALVVEWQLRGALHPHVFAVVAPEVAEDLRDRSTRASYRRRMHELRPLATSLGWGQMVDAVTPRAIEAGKLSQYGAKALSGYATKEAATKFKEVGAKRVRPLRLSRGWYPGGLVAAREYVTERAPDRQTGRWEHVRSVCAS